MIFQKRKAFSLPEVIIVLTILLLSVTSFTTLALNYFLALASIKERFLALNLAQEGLELSLALRNKQIEKEENVNWLGVTSTGSYCLSFNTSTKQITVLSSSNPCSVIQNYSRLITYTDFENPSNTVLTRSRAVRVTSEVRFLKDKVQLDTLITRWHFVQ